MSFPSPPVPDQEYTHTNGITYIYSDSKKAWEIYYQQATNTGSLPLINPSSRYLPAAGASLPDSGGLLTQADYNQWAFNSLVKVDETSRVDAGESAPGDADTNQLWYKPSTGSLYVYYNDGSSSQWVEIGGSDPGNTYTIETDPLSGFPQIKLVDQDGASSEVHFTATGDLTVSSNASSINYSVNLSPYATKVYSDAGDLFLQNQLDNLEIEKGTVATYDCVDTQLGMTNARTGECIFSDPTASAAIIIGFGTEDKSGNLTHPIANGDIIEVIAPGGVVSRYAVNDNASAPTMVAVTFVSGDQTFSAGTEYSVYIYPQNAAGVSKDYVDAQDQATQQAAQTYTDEQIAAIPDPDLSTHISKTGTQDLDSSEWKVRQPNQDGAHRSFIDIYDGTMKLFNVADPSNGGNSGWAANKGYVDDNFIGSAGTQTLTAGNWNIRQPNANGDNKNFIVIEDGTMNLYHVADPTNHDDGWAANKGYVDAQIAALPSVNLDNYLPLVGGSMTGRIDITMPDAGTAAIRTIGTINVKADGEAIGGGNNFIATPNYVRVASTPVSGDDVVNKTFADSNYVKQTMRPGLRFRYETGSGVPPSGKFTWYNSGGQKLKINATTTNGIPWAVDTPVVDFNFGSVGTGPTFAIWATVSGTNNWRLKKFGTITRIDFHADDILCYIASDFTENGSFSTSAEYNITIAGLI